MHLAPSRRRPQSLTRPAFALHRLALYLLVAAGAIDRLLG